MISFKTILLLILKFSIVYCNSTVSPSVIIIAHSLERYENKSGFIRVNSTIIRGNELKINETAVDEYLGIGYAKPPVDDKRFGKPEFLEILSENKTIDATKPSNSCIQATSNIGFESKYFNDSKMNQSEDCLYLNIWVPNRETKNKSVLVFVHGGGLRFGSSNLDLYNGSMLAAKTGLIVVTLNYRLGIFGFAYMCCGNNITGNMGLLDQQVALKWINKYIRAFSGDPQNVTLWGQGAGAKCASAHLFSKESENYFQKLILMSGSINSLLYSMNQGYVDTKTRQTAINLKCYNSIKMYPKPHKEIFECMLKNETADIVKYSENVTFQTNMPSALGFNIILNDTVFFNGTLSNKLKTGDMKYRVDILFGMPNKAGSFFLPILKDAPKYNCSITGLFNYSSETCKMNKTHFETFCKYIKGPLKMDDNTIKIVKDTYLSSNGSRKNKTIAIKVLTDVSFRCHLIDFMRKVNIKTMGSIYGYYFNVSSAKNKWPRWMVSTHGDELDYAFGLPFRYPSDYGDNVTNEQEFSKNVMEMIKNFTDSSTPSLEWEKFIDTDREGTFIGPDFYNSRKLSLVEDMETNECRTVMPHLPMFLMGG
uniref:acetylcholinesterase n=1 Tax=Parastrongyloides trichosuri TaxID=131310 RepID=A0A0N4Z6A0_PARTI